MTEKSPQSIWRFESDVGRRERRDERSTSAPANICARMLWVTWGGSRATAFDGMGIGVAVKSEWGDFAWRRVVATTGGGAVFGSDCGQALA